MALKGRIFENKVQCAKCLDFLVSRRVHDFVSCRCGSVSIDGGTEYLRRIYQDERDFIELTTYEEAII